MNKLITALALALALAGCGSDPINRDQGDPRQAAQGMELNWLVARMTDQLMERKSLTTLTEPIAVASFVDLDTLQDTGAQLGKKIQNVLCLGAGRLGQEDAAGAAVALDCAALDHAVTLKPVEEPHQRRLLDVEQAGEVGLDRAVPLGELHQ